MHALQGGCHCGNIRLELTLTRVPGSYNPRACDCDFCTKHSAAYISDPAGTLEVRIRDESRANRYRQGSGQAEFLICAECGVLAGVFYASAEGVRGAVNARAVEGGAAFGPMQAVSPKNLSPADKARRWQDVWFPNVATIRDRGAR